MTGSSPVFSTRWVMVNKRDEKAAAPEPYRGADELPYDWSDE